MRKANANWSAWVSPEDFENFELRGEFRVNTNVDDDSLGVVFGYRGPLDVGDPVRDT